MYIPIIKELPEMIVASLRHIIPNYDALDALFPEVMGKEMDKVGCVCTVPEYTFIMYHDDECRETDIDVELWKTVTELNPDTDILKFKKVAAVSTALCVLHKGSYENMEEAYSFAMKWIEENKYEMVADSRESYIDGKWNKENVDDWLTELQFPVVLKE